MKIEKINDNTIKIIRETTTSEVVDYETLTERKASLEELKLARIAELDKQIAEIDGQIKEAKKLGVKERLKEII